MKNTISYAAFLLSIIALSASLFMNAGIKSSQGERVFDKIISSGVIKAGYIAYPPYIIKDPNTGKLSGLFYELTEEMGKQLGLRVEWVEEGGYGTIFTSLNSGRYDIYAGGLWANSSRAKAGYLTSPVFFDPLYSYARTSDHRFDKDTSLINNPNVKISTLDGEMGSIIAKLDYPKAKEVSLPQTSPAGQLMLQVVSGKADIVFLSPDAIDSFLKTNPGTLRKVSDTPLKVFGNVYAVKTGEVDLYQMLQAAITEAVDAGVVKKVVEKYQTTSDSHLFLDLPYGK